MAKVSMMEKATTHVVLDHPFFAAMLLRHPPIQDERVGTIQISARGQLRYNPKWFETLPVKQAVWALCHEMFHYASLHHIRKGSREWKQWQEACDMWVNDTLKEMNVGEQIPQTVEAPGANALTCEDIYDQLQSQPQPQGGSGKKGKGAGGQQQFRSHNGNDPMKDDLGGKNPGEGGADGDGKGDDGGNGDKLTDAERQELEANVKLEVAEAMQTAKMRGDVSGILQNFVSNLIDTKTPWYEILERFMVERTANDLSWARPNRRYHVEPDYIYLPILDSIGTMGSIVVQVDVSGSISKEEIAYYNGHLKRIVELCSPEKVHVLYTDTRVLKHEEFERADEFEITFYSGGGTDMRAGIDYIESKGIEPSVFITLTDGYTPFPEKDPPFPTIWCISSDQKSPTGENVHFNMRD